MKGKFKGIAFSNLSKALTLSFIVLFGGFIYRVNSHDILKELSEQKDYQRLPVLLNNERALVPFKDLSGRKIASINIGFGNSQVFDDMLRKYDAVTSFDISTIGSLDNFGRFNTLIIQVTAESALNSQTISLYKKLKNQRML